MEKDGFKEEIVEKEVKIALLKKYDPSSGSGTGGNQKKKDGWGALRNKRPVIKANGDSTPNRK